MLVKLCLSVVFSFFVPGITCKRVEVLAEAGSQALLPCLSNPRMSSEPTVVWTKDGNGTVWKRLQSGLQYWGSNWRHNGITRVRCLHSGFERGNFSLLFSRVRPEDGGLYSCKVDFNRQATERLVMLRVIEVSITPSRPKWGEDVCVSCKVMPWPKGASFQWFLNDKLFKHQNGSILKDNASTVRQSASERLHGKWTCVVNYQRSEGQASAFLSFQGVTQPNTDGLQVYAAAGSAVTLPCLFPPGSLLQSSTWEKLAEDSQFGPAVTHLPPSFSPSSSPAQPSWDKSVSLTQVGLENKGLYRCVGIVRGERLTHTVRLVVATILPSKENGSLTLTCHLTNTTEVTQYEWVHATYGFSGIKFEKIIRGPNMAIMTMVSERDLGEWMCRFYGKNGILGNVTYHVETMAGLGGEKPLEGSYDNIIVAGICIIIVGLLLILAHMYKTHQRRRRISRFFALRESVIYSSPNKYTEGEKESQRNSECTVEM